MLSKLNISWHRIISFTRCLISSKPTDTVEINQSTLSGSESSDIGAVIDIIDNQQPILPYSQKALETLK